MQTESAIVKSKSSLLLLSALILLFASFFITELVSFSKGHVMICHLPCEAAPSFRTDEQSARLLEKGDVLWIGEYSAIGLFYVDSKTITVAYGNQDYFLHQEDISPVNPTRLKGWKRPCRQRAQS